MSFGLHSYGLENLPANGILDPMSATYGVSPFDQPLGAPYGYLAPQPGYDEFVHKKQSRENWLSLLLAAIAGAVGFKYKDKILGSIPGTPANAAKKAEEEAAKKAAEAAQKSGKFWGIAKKVGKYGGIGLACVAGLLLVLKVAGGFLKGRMQKQQAAAQGAMPVEQAQQGPAPTEVQMPEAQQQAAAPQPEAPQQAA